MRPLPQVHFDGEAGIDEGGLRKEFFSLLTAALLTPSYGMFVEDPDTRALWFCADSLEANIQVREWLQGGVAAMAAVAMCALRVFTAGDRVARSHSRLIFPLFPQFELVGCLLGLALYNSIIVAASFPIVVYR